MSSVLKLSDSASLAIHAMALLVRNPDGRYSSGRVAEILGASEHTLAKVMLALVKAKLANAVRGANGGFTLACNPDKVTVLQVYELIEGKIERPACLLGKPACKGKECVMHGLIEKLNLEVRSFFGSITLAQLAKSVVLG